MAAYQTAVQGLDAAALSQHYTAGGEWLRGVFTPHLKTALSDLSGGRWDLSDFVAFAAGSDVDFITHLVEAVACEEGATLYPGDWYGFLVGCTRTDNIRFAPRAPGRLACLCLPSVRNGHLTEDMVAFLESAPAHLLNINLYPTLRPAERLAVAERLAPLLDRSILSVSFSRGFGLTASQLGVALVHRDHPFVARFARQWGWHTFFFNAIAARAFMAIDLAELARVDEARRQWVRAWLDARGLPAVDTGSYYVKTFRLEGEPDEALRPLVRDGRVRLCFKPPVV